MCRYLLLSRFTSNSCHYFILYLLRPYIARSFPFPVPNTFPRRISQLPLFNFPFVFILPTWLFCSVVFFLIPFHRYDYSPGTSVTYDYACVLIAVCLSSYIQRFIDELHIMHYYLYNITFVLYFRSVSLHVFVVCFHHSNHSTQY